MSNDNIIAIIDDNALVRESVKRLVNSMSYGAKTFLSTDEFLASDAIGHVRCVISDVEIPGGNSRTLQKQLMERGFDIPVIFMTAQQNRKVKAELLDAGALCVLDKPFNQNEMTNCIAEAMRHTSAHATATRESMR